MDLLNQIAIGINVYKKKRLISKTKTTDFFQSLSIYLKPGDVVCLNGSLGVGKTFTSGIIINKLTGNKLISSPTFNLVKTYFVNNKLEIWHCDFYRLNDASEIEEIGIFENINEKIVIIEWPKFDEIFNFNPLIIEIEFGKKINERNIFLKLSSEWRKRINFLVN
tara:strand:+ start:310 stop:804 length:495 start_codon:yes stop_codon:yes gene_type:complete